MRKHYFVKASQKTHWLFCVGLIVLFIIPYGIVNHLPLHRYTIPFILGEEYIPFLPWTFILYFSSFLQTLLVVRNLPRLLVRKVLQVLSVTVVVCLLMFIFIPIRFPRELYISNNSFVNRFQKVDNSGNCFPSLHVALTIFFAYTWSLIESAKLLRMLIYLWTFVIVISVLTTKQHYLVDVFGGIAVAIISIFSLRIIYKKENKYRQ